MGDMKTPDFDDLLAAFDIPDIDAKEAIQSESGDPDGNHSESSGGKDRSGCPNQKPGLSDPREAPHDTSVVSVIVKNSICPDLYESRREEDVEDETIRQVSDVLDGTDRSGDGSPQVAHSLLPMEPLIHNGFKAVSESIVEASLLSSQSQTQPKSHFWSPCSPKIAREGDENNRDGNPTDPSATFPPLPASAPSVSCSNLIGLTPPKADEDVAGRPASPFTSQTRPFDGIPLAGVQNALSDDESEAEPDLGSSPLVIQESPEQHRSPPKFPRRQKPSPDLQNLSPSSPSLPISNARTEEATSASEQPDSSAPPQALPQNSDPTTSVPETVDPSKPERYPEHIIEERDSPESPEPEMPAPQWNKVLSTPIQEVEKLPEQDRTVEVSEKEEPMETDDERVKCDRAEEEEKKEDPDEEKPTEPVRVASANSSGSAIPSRPLKVRIKTVKTPTGNVTRTVTRVAPKGGAPGMSKGPETSKVPMGGHKVIMRPKRPAAAMSNQPRDSKAARLPVSTLQDASSAMLFAASKAQKVTASSRVAKLTSSSSISICTAGQKSASAPAAKLASIVSNPGAVISRSQSSLVEAFNKILNSKNPLPSYQPDLSVLPRPEWGLGMPASGYRCLECGDAFALERSLARHYDRRSLRIEVTCNHCMKRLAFFNKCSLLLHAREHKEKGLVMQCSHLIMKPISMEHMVGQQDTVPIGVLSTSSVRGAKEEAVQTGCPECKTQFSSKENLAAHFQESEAGLDICCMQCSPPMPLWNSCSAAAHQRLHQKLPPLVCPECGLSCQSHSLNKHLYQHCLHYTRQLGYRCPCCQLVFGGVNSMSAVKNHMHSTHCEVFHKCPSCPMAFKSTSSVEGHCNTQHPNLSDTAKQSKEIYKCVMCRTVFTQKALLNHHFDTHLGTQKVPVFKCLDCNKLFTQRPSLLEHIKVSHRKSAVHLTKRGSARMESSDGEEWRREEEDDEEGDEDARRNESSAAFNVQIWRCSECQTRYGDKESYISHMAKQHRKELKMFPCMLCESSFSSSSSLRRHFRVKHKGMKRSFYCQLCTRGKKSFSSKLVLEKHMQIHHRGPKAANAPNQVNSLFTDTADSSSEQDGAFNPATARRHESKVARHGRAQGTRPGRFRCRPCGYASEDKQDFALHIQAHRGDGDKALQCQQCGACFASGSSLSRHRFISHGLREADGDERDAGAGADFAPDSESPDEEGEDRLSCKVCGRQFSRAADLNTHFRTHGMAFISAYKTEKPI